VLNLSVWRVMVADMANPWKARGSQRIYLQVWIAVN